MAARTKRTGGVAGSIRDAFLNFRPSTLSFVLMRITGLALVAYLFLHIWTIGAVRRAAAGGSAQQAFDASVRAYDTPVGHLIEYLLLACVLAHGANGIRLILADWLRLSRAQAKLLWGAAAIVAVALAAAYPVFFPCWCR